jgi:DNA polymerase III subunit delta
MYYLFYGEDDLTRSEQIKKLREKMGDPQFADLNTTQFDGRKVTLGELLHACNAVPFLTDKRLVIVEGLLARLNPRTKSATKSKAEDEETEMVEEEEVNPELAKGLIEYLPHLPETTRLIFVEAKPLAKNNPVLKQATADAEAKKAVVKEFTAPKDPTRWILDRVKHKGGTIADDAANELAAHIGSDLRLLDNEIEKLITFRANELIRTEDVRALVASVHESNIFALVDAIGNRQTKTA